MFRKVQVLPCWPIEPPPGLDRRAKNASLAKAQPRTLAAFRPKIPLSSCANLPSQLSLKHANCHPLTVVNFEFGALVRRNRRWTIGAPHLYNPAAITPLRRDLANFRRRPGSSVGRACD